MLGDVALPASRFYRHKTHARSTNGFADGLSIRRVVLASADIWFDVRWWDQSNLVPIGCDRASPIMGGGAGFDADEARRKSRKEIGQLRSLKPSAHDNSTCRVNTVHLKDTLARSRPNVVTCIADGSRLWRSPTTTSWHIDAVQQGPSTPSTPVAPNDQIAIEIENPVNLWGQQITYRQPRKGGPTDVLVFKTPPKVNYRSTLQIRRTC